MIVFGSDHAGFELKRHLMQYLQTKGVETKDIGTATLESCGYAPFGEAAARQAAEGRAQAAVIICGTGLGISMAANKVRGARAALCTNEYMARMARMHNDANVLALGARVVGTGLAEAILDAFLGTQFEGGRHAERVQQMMEIENKR